MNLSDLKPPKGARKNRKRVGRGPGSGNGKTAGRGHKGQRSRTSGNVRPGFEGGQMPLSRRLPKFGFWSPFRTEYTVVNVGDLAKRFKDGDTIDPEALKNAGMVRAKLPVKILASGEISIKLTVKAHKFSKAAAKKIEGAGGSVEVLKSKKKKDGKPAKDSDNKDK